MKSYLFDMDYSNVFLFVLMKRKRVFFDQTFAVFCRSEDVKLLSMETTNKKVNSLQRLPTSHITVDNEGNFLETTNRPRITQSEVF